MIVDTLVQVPVHPRTHKMYSGKFPVVAGKYQVPIDSLSTGSTSPIEKVCDICGRHQILPARWVFRGRAKYGKDICDTCIRSESGKATAGKGHSWTPEERARARESHLGKVHSEASKRKRANTLRQTIASAEYQAAKAKRLHERSLLGYVQRFGPELGPERYKEEILKKTPRSLHYWLAKGLTYEEATQKLSAFQTRDLDFFVRKYGAEEGEARYQQVCEARAVRRWSKKSKEFFDLIVASLELDPSKVYYAEDEWLVSLFREEREKLNQRVLLLDFFDRERNLAIEFDGTYWHQHSQERDALRDAVLRNRGIRVIRISEQEYDLDCASVLLKVQKEYLAI